MEDRSRRDLRLFAEGSWGVSSSVTAIKGWAAEAEPFAARMVKKFNGPSDVEGGVTFGCLQVRFQGAFVVVVSFLLVCAVLGSLAAGVLVAYGVCVAMFGVFRLHARQAATTRRVAAEALLEG